MEKVTFFFTLEDLKRLCKYYKVIVGNCMPNFNDGMQRLAEISCF